MSPRAKNIVQSKKLRSYLTGEADESSTPSSMSEAVENDENESSTTNIKEDSGSDGDSGADDDDTTSPLHSVAPSTAAGRRQSRRILQLRQCGDDEVVDEPVATVESKPNRVKPAGNKQSKQCLKLKRGWGVSTFKEIAEHHLYLLRKLSKQRREETFKTHKRDSVMYAGPFYHCDKNDIIEELNMHHQVVVSNKARYIYV